MPISDQDPPHRTTAIDHARRPLALHAARRAVCGNTPPPTPIREPSGVQRQLKTVAGAQSFPMESTPALRLNGDVRSRRKMCNEGTLLGALPVTRHRRRCERERGDSPQLLRPLSHNSYGALPARLRERSGRRSEIHGSVQIDMPTKKHLEAERQHPLGVQLGLGILRFPQLPETPIQSALPSRRGARLPI